MPDRSSFLGYIRESWAASSAVLVALVGGGIALAFKVLGKEGPVPLWVTWLVCLVVAALAPYWIYAKLHKRHKALASRARSAARLPPEVRAVIYEIKRRAGAINAGLQGHSQIDYETLDEDLDALWSLGAGVGEHERIRSKLTFYVANIRTVWGAIRESQDPEERRSHYQYLNREDRAFFQLLIQGCNDVLEAYPPVEVIEARLDDD